MKKFIAVLLMTTLMIMSFAACGSNNVYNDGTFNGTGTVDIKSDYGNVNYDVKAELTVKDGVITNLEIKPGETNDDFEKMIDNAVKTYVKTDGKEEVAAVDTIAGATVSHDAMMDAINDALSQAKN